MSPTDTSLTPMMQQYFEAKRAHPDAVVFFRMGDFYEMFYDDAETASKVLDITLTARGRGPDGEATPMCGVPAAAHEGYLARMVKAGYRVAICDQVEDPRHAKGIVKREVVRVVSPGTFSDGEAESARRSNYLAALAEIKGTLGLALAELSTGRIELLESSGDPAAWLAEELARSQPSELLLADDSELRGELAARDGSTLTLRPRSLFDASVGRRRLERQIKAPLQAHGLDGLEAAQAAAGALLTYLEETQKSSLDHLNDVRAVRDAETLVIDATTARNLELTRSLADGGTRATLLGALDRSETPMGARLLREWLLRPPRARARIEERLAAVAALVEDERARSAIREALGPVRDVERLTSRVALKTANARDLVALAASLAPVGGLKGVAGSLAARLLAETADELDPLEDVTAAISAALLPEPAVGLKDGGLIRAGFHAELDELQRLAREGKGSLAAIETRERASTGIGSLKVKFNRVFGYFIEVSKANLAHVPAHYERRQTLANAERFVTPELRDWEARVLSAEDKLLELEYELFCELRDRVGLETGRIGTTARALARLDVLATFAELAALRAWVRPRFVDEPRLKIVDGRHPVIEHALGRERFVPNDTLLDPAERAIAIITGPNMGGKSTYLRQVALIAIMAHAGSFVPAAEVELGSLDRIFARVGASDDLARGSSTFMVEMMETANILNCQSDRSLILLDEVGRGTATFDGVSLAWAIVEYLHDHPRGAAKVLFATHYHELTDLAGLLPRVVNLRVAVREWKDDIVFLRRIEEGRSDRSYGIHVARLAGIPDPVVARAKEVLSNLESAELDLLGTSRLARHAEPNRQLELFGAIEHPLLRDLRQLETDGLTPLEALNLLAELARRARAG